MEAPRKCFSWSSKKIFALRLDPSPAALSRFRSLFVIARNSTFTYKGRAVDVRQVARELGVKNVLEGSVRTASNRVRVGLKARGGKR